MKRYIALLFFFTYITTSVAQVKDNMLSKKANLEKSSYTIRELLNEINDSPEFNIVFNGNDKELDTRIEISESAQTLEDILKVICEVIPYKYVEKNGHLIFKKKKLSDKYRIEGRIYDAETNENLAAASIVIENTNKGSFSNNNGTYSFSLPPGIYSIICSYVGYKTEITQINLYDNKVINFELQPTSQNLKEVRIVEERTFFADFEKGRTIETITPETIEKVTGNNASDILHARLKGVWASKTSGAPGDHQRIRIRGLNSIFGNVDPLYVVDGVPVPNVNYFSLGIADLNKHDIESITILKDASSTALYGFQGVNGVILIDTKRGGEKKIEFQTTHGIQWFEKRYPLMNTKDFLETYKLSDSILHTDYFANYYPRYALYPEYNNTMGSTDMQDLLFTHGLSHEYQLAAQGSLKDYNYYISGNYFTQSGVVDYSKYDRYTLTTNFNKNFTNKFVLNMMYKTSLQENKDNLDNYLGNDNVFQIINTEPGYYWTPDSFFVKYGRHHYNYESFGRPVDPKQKLRSYNRGNRIIHHSLYTSGEYSITQGLSLIAEYAFSRRKITYTSDIEECYLESEEYYTVLNQQYHLKYKNKFNNHGITAITGWRNYGDNVNWRVLSYEIVDLSNVSDKDDIFLRGSMSVYGETGDVARFVNSFVGHLNYDFKEKYFVSFAANKEYLREGFNAKVNDIFSSVALTWDLAKEWGLNRIKQLDHLLLYTNWGVSGNYPLNSLANDLYNSTTYIYGTIPARGAYLTNLSNPDLLHEKVWEINYGAELSMFNERCILNVDWFSKTNTDLIIQRDIPYYYGGGYYFINLAKMENEGLEFSINLIPIETKNFSWQSGFNYSQNNQVIRKLDNDSILYFNSADILYPDFHIQEHERLGDIAGYKYLGRNVPLAEGEEELRYVAVRSGIRYQCKDSLGRNFNDDDKVVIGNSLPKFYWNWHNSFTYKNFGVDIIWYAVIGVDKYNSTRASSYISGTNADVTGIIADTLTCHRDNCFYESSYFVEDASFIRLKTVAFTYTPSKEIFNGVHTKFTVSFDNLLTITGYSGYDPEASIYTDNNFSNNAIDRGAFPIPKSIYFAIKLRL